MGMPKSGSNHRRTWLHGWWPAETGAHHSYVGPAVGHDGHIAQQHVQILIAESFPVSRHLRPARSDLNAIDLVVAVHPHA